MAEFDNQKINFDNNGNDNSNANSNVNNNVNSNGNSSDNNGGNSSFGSNGSIYGNSNSNYRSSNSNYGNSNSNDGSSNSNSGYGGNSNVNASSNINGYGNNYGSQSNIPNQAGRVPEYNFWAEQVPGGSYSRYNPNTNSWEYTASATEVHGNSKKTKKDHSKGKRRVKFLMKAVCFGLIAAFSFVGFQGIYYHFNPNAAQISVNLDSSDGKLGFNLPANNYQLQVTQPGNVTTESKSVISDVVNKSMASIVSIDGETTQSEIWFGQQFSQPAQQSGSGIVVGKKDNELLIATNNHVVEGTEKITVTFIDGKKAPAVIKGTDATADLAVISVDTSKLEKATLDAIQIAKLGNSDQIKVGEMSIAIGNALGYGQSVTVGYISAKDREVDVSDGYTSKKMILLQTDAAINPGNSGGALLNAKGEVIGINTVKYASNEVEGMGYAIPITKATPVINELMNREVLKESEQGYLGIAGNDVTEDISSALNLPIGVFVTDVSENGAAQKAGLQKNDIITKVNDVEVTSISQLKDYVNSLRVGTEVKITYMRNANGTYQENTVNVTLGPNPNLSTAN
jgi:serine protease Do